MSKRKQKLEMARREEMRKRFIKWICSLCLLGAIGIAYWNWQSDQQMRKIDEKLSRGDLLMGQGNERGALEVYAGVANTAPERIEPWVKMASVHAAAKRYEEALPFYEEALLVDKNHFETRVGLAICKEGLGDFLAAEVHYKKAILLESDYSEAYHNFGRLLSNSGRLDEARVNFENAI